MLRCRPVSDGGAIFALWDEAAHEAEKKKLDTKYEHSELLGRGAFGEVCAC